MCLSPRISSKNNSRKYKGESKQNTNDPHLHTIQFDAFPIHKSQYEVKFTENELQSSETFCKGISKIISVIYGKWSLKQI